MNTLDFILENKVITICRKVYGENLLKLAQALYAGGVKLIEVTFDQACLNIYAKMCRPAEEGGAMQPWDLDAR